MKKYFFLLLATFGLLTVSCGDDDANEENGASKSIVGEWSGVREIGSTDIYVHYSFGKDGRFTVYMPAWGEVRGGTYSVKDGKVTLVVTALGYIGSDGKPDYDESIYSAKYDRENFEEWTKGWPEDVRCTSPYYFDKQGYLYLPETNIGGGLDLTYFSDPDYVPYK